MFCDCHSLNELYFPNYNFVTKNVLDISFMFYNCQSLRNINISNFFISSNTKVNSMFYGIPVDLIKKIKAQKYFKDLRAFSIYFGNIVMSLASHVRYPIW